VKLTRYSKREEQTNSAAPALISARRKDLRVSYDPDDRTVTIHIEDFNEDRPGSYEAELVLSDREVAELFWRVGTLVASGGTDLVAKQQGRLSQLEAEVARLAAKP
jgi:hypothetical protein